MDLREIGKWDTTSLRVYFAAHAPEVPNLFRKNWEQTQGNGDETGLIVEWRFRYARRMADRFEEARQSEQR